MGHEDGDSGLILAFHLLAAPASLCRIARALLPPGAVTVWEGCAGGGRALDTRGHDLRLSGLGPGRLPVQAGVGLQVAPERDDPRAKERTTSRESRRRAGCRRSRLGHESSGSVAAVFEHSCP